MDRLTWEYSEGGIYLDGTEISPSDFEGHVVYYGPAVDRLAAYEDTGLTPEGITANMEMFAAYRHVCGGKSPDEVTQAFAENARLRAERDKAVEDLTEMANRANMEDLCVFCKWWTPGGCAILAPNNPNACFVWRGTEGKA